MSETLSFKEVYCQYATEKAILVEIDGDPYWIPQSVVHDDSEVWRKEDFGTLVLHRWWVEKSEKRDSLMVCATLGDGT